MLKVFHLLTHFLPHKIAGTEIYTWALCKRLQKEFDLKIVVPNLGSFVNEEYQYDSLNVFRYAEPSLVDRSLIMGKRLPDGLNNFKLLLQKEKPNIIHFHELGGNSGITLHHLREAKKIGAKIIGTFHLSGYTCRTGTLVHQGKNICNGLIDINRCSTCYLHSKGYGYISSALVPISSLLYDLGIESTNWNNKIGTALGTVELMNQFKDKFYRLIDLCDHIVILTDWYRRILLENGIDHKKMTLIKQALPFSTIKNYNPYSVLKSEPIKLVFIGRINPLKGLHLLLNAISGISENLIQLDIYGYSDDIKYEKMCRSLTEAKSNIQWRGKISQEDVVSTLKNYHALCLCSTFSEMSPLVIQEAFAAGIPIIASAVLGNMDQVQHNFNGLLFRFNDCESLKKQLQRCIEEPNLLQALSKNVPSTISFDEISQNYIRLYQNLMHQ